MELITFIFALFEILIFFFQFIFYLSRPQDQSRLWYLILLGLLITYNITGGLFPDKNIPISITVQNIIAYCSGFVMASYIPFYFYKAYNLKALRFHALYGIYIFLIVPFLLFFVIEYSFNGNLTMARHRGVIIPLLYAIYFVYIIFKEVKKKLKDDMSNQNIITAVIVCCAVLPWSTMPLLAYYNVSQAFEVSVCNTGFCIMTVIFMRQNIINSKVEYKKLQEYSIVKSESVNKVSQEQRFEINCNAYGLTIREKEIVKLIDKGLKYKKISDTLFIAERTVSKHVQNIFEKVDVSNRIELLKKLNQ